MPRYFPELATFQTMARQADVVPVYRQLLSDHLTPVTAFELLGRDQQHAMLLESVVGNEKIGRYSFIAAGPTVVYRVKDGKARIQRPSKGDVDFQTTDPLKDLADLLEQRTYLRDKSLPPFTGGLVGYAGYDTVRYYEGEKLPDAPEDDRDLPDLLMGLYESLVIFDQVDKTIKVVANASVRESDPGTAYERACEQIDAIVDKLQKPPRSRLGEFDPRGALTLEVQSNMTRQAFEDAVRAAQEYIKAGDIFQVVPSQRLRVRSKAEPFDVYRALRVINPSPFMFYLKTADCILIGASPEILCRVADRVMTSRPLAGTRKRGASEEEDKKLEEELLADPKERAEHIMLVDLHRNDVGRVVAARPSTRTRISGELPISVHPGPFR